MITDPVTADRIGLDWLKAALAPASAFGRRHDEAFVPYAAGEEPRARAEIAEIVVYAERLDPDGVGRARGVLRATPDPAAIVSRARVGDSLSDVDFYELDRFVDALDALARAWDAARGDAQRRPPVLDALRALLAPGRDGESFYLADAFASGLRAARAALADAEAAYEAQREAIAARVRAAIGIDPLGEEFVVLRDVYDGPLPDDVLIVRETPTYRVATVRVIAPERDAALARLAVEEERARHTLAEQVALHADAIVAAAEALGALDRLLARVAFTQRWGGSVPVFTGDVMRFREAVFAPLAEAVAANGRTYTRISLTLEGVAVLSGPNMGGKSAALATAGFLAACVASGVPPPACDVALPVFARTVWIGGEGPQERARLLSSFAAEVVRVEEALGAAGRSTLILVDEFARTTGPREGWSLLVALVEALRARRAFALVATHFDAVAETARVPHLRIAGLRTTAFDGVRAGDLDTALDAINAAMDYRVVDAHEAAIASDALVLARLLGLDAQLVERASALVERPVEPSEPERE